MFISIHIPKTAGTTIAYILDYGLNRRILYDYKEDYAADPPTEYLLRHKEFIEDHFDVIHGHFRYKKYAEAFPNAQFLTTIRHPVARVVSQYNHILNLSPEKAAWPAKEIILGKMDLVEFASIQSIGNAQSVFLEGRGIDDYSFIFVTERLERSLMLFQSMFGFERRDPGPPGGLPLINSGDLREKRVNPSRSELVKVYEQTGEDNELYRKAIEWLDRLHLKMR